MKHAAKTFALCLENAGNEASLILGKVNRIVPDGRAAKDNLVRIIMKAATITCSTELSSLSSTFRKPSGRGFLLFNGRLTSRWIRRRPHGYDEQIEWTPAPPPSMRRFYAICGLTFKPEKDYRSS